MSGNGAVFRETWNIITVRFGEDVKSIWDWMSSNVESFVAINDLYR